MSSKAFLITFTISFILPSAFSYLGLPLLSCNPACLTCSGPNANQCLTCVSGLLPIGSACACAAGKYYAGGLNTCKPCDASCQTCDDGTSDGCLTCPTGYQLYQGSCYHSCTSTQYLTTTDFSCASCNSLCKTCTGPSAADCTSCSTANLVNGVCTCPSGYYVTTYGGCAQCDSSCKECSGSAATQCTMCNNAMILQSGQCLCPTGFYRCATPSSCLTCNETCQGCSGPSANQCTSCQNNLVLTSQQRCECPSNMYYYSQNVSCLPCSPLCSSCTGTGTNKNECTSCKNNLALTADSTCGCGSGWYLNTSTATCVSCDKSCQECTGPSASECSSCSSAWYNLNNGRCVCAGGAGGCQCPSDKYYDAGASMCRDCDASCAECSGHSSQNCTACATDFSLYLGECVCQQSTCQCASGTYFDTPSGTCKACNDDCQECSGLTSNECTSCKNNLAIPSGSSSGVCTCGDGMFLDLVAGMCLACSSTCKTCSGPASTQCLQCSSGATLSSGSCICNVGLYFDQHTAECLSCDASCPICSGPERSQCLSCSAGQILDNGYCVDICTPNQYRMSDMSCQSCDASCQTCSGGSANQCKSCVAPLTLSGGTCSDVSSNGCYYKCKSCLSSLQNECTQCNTGLILIRTVTYSYGYCDTNCPIGYFYKYNNGQPICQPKIRLDNGLAYATNTGDSNGNNQIQITFDKKIIPFLSELINSISIAIDFRPDQPQIEFKYSLDLMSNSQYLLLTLTYLGHLLPGNILTINYNLPSKTSSDHNSTIYVVRQTQSVRLMEYYDPSTAVTQYTKAMTKFASISVIGNQLFSWTSSVIFRGVHALRSEIIEDMIGYIIFMNIDFTPNFLEFANDGLNSFELIFPNIFAYLLEYMNKKEASNENNSESRILEKWSAEEEKIPSAYKDIHMKKLEKKGGKLRSLINQGIQTSINEQTSSRYFLSNHGTATGFIIIVVIVMLIIESCHYGLGKAQRFTKLRKIFQKVSLATRWNMLIGHFSSEFQGFVFFSILDLASNLPLNRGTERLSFVFSLICLCISSIVVVLLLVLPFILQKRLELLSVETDSLRKTKIHHFLQRFEILHQNFHSKEAVMLLYPALLHLRSYGFGIILVFGSASPYGQISYLAVSTIAVLIYLKYYKPFKTRGQYILTLIYEIVFLCLIIVVLGLHTYNQKHLRDIATRTLICMIMVGLATMLFALNCISFIFEIVSYIRGRSKNKRVTPVKLKKDFPVLETKHTETPLHDTDFKNSSVAMTTDGPEMDNLKPSQDRLIGSIRIQGIRSVKKGDFWQISSDRTKRTGLEENITSLTSFKGTKDKFNKETQDKIRFIRGYVPNRDIIEPKRKKLYENMDCRAKGESNSQTDDLSLPRQSAQNFDDLRTEGSIMSICEPDKLSPPKSRFAESSLLKLDIVKTKTFQRKNSFVQSSLTFAPSQREGSVREINRLSAISVEVPEEEKDNEKK